MSAAIKVENLQKSYGDNKVLGGIGFEVEKGEIFALLGVNGAGKTTTLECVEGLRKYDGGHIEVNGKRGIQLQSASLPSCIKACEAVKLFAKWNHVKPDGEMLCALGIDEIAKKRYSDMSTGQKRRLHLALALTGNPDIIFLDEPTAGLDVEGRISLHAQIRALRDSGKTIILASHDMAEVESLCDRIAVLNSGKIVFVGSVDELTAKVGRRYGITVTTDSGNERFDSYNIADTLLSLLEDYRRRGVEVRDIKVDRGTLEQHFIDLAARKEDAV